MHMLIAGITRRFGTSKSGKPYDMTQLLVLEPAADGAFATSTIEAVGYKIAEIDAAQSLVQKMKLAQLKFPCLLDLEIGHEMRFGKINSIVVDYKVPVTGKDL